MPSMPPLSPSTLPSGQRRRQRWSDRSRVSYVPLEDVSEELTGLIRVPKSLALAPAHTNEALKLQGLIRENLDRWVEWRRQRGWQFVRIVSMGHAGPPLTEGTPKARAFRAKAEKVIGQGAEVRAISEFDAPEEIWHIYVKGEFKRSTPVYQRLEDVLFFKELTEMYAKEKPVKDSGPVNPLEYAEARRQRLGLKRKDYLLGKLSEPL